MNKDLIKAIANTLCSDEATDFAAEFIEIGLDSMLKDGILKDIPILGSVAKIYDFGTNLSNRLFANKLMTVVANFGKLTDKEKEKIRSALNSASDEKIGEQMFLLTDKFESNEKSAMFGKVLKAYLIGDLSKSEYDVMAHAIVNLFLNDMEYMFLPPVEIQKIEPTATLRLYQLSLFECPLEIIDENGSPYNSKKYCLSIVGVKFANIVFGKNLKYDAHENSHQYFDELGLNKPRE